MDIPKNIKRVVITIGPSDNPYAKVFLPDKRKGRKDRRELHTYIFKDRRSGIVDRRNRNENNL
ncbi:MAG: hypothetical protein JRF56_07595 [Deltaproteobacteria bacterium]|jgi:hypothetical protein|nr:hypothetical protein [Deltaproteobacteria bacterium]